MDKPPEIGRIIEARVVAEGVDYITMKVTDTGSMDKYADQCMVMGKDTITGKENVFLVYRYKYIELDDMLTGSF